MSHDLKQAVIRLRAASGMTQQEFAVHFGFSVRLIAYYESGERAPAGRSLAQFAKYAWELNETGVSAIFWAALETELGLTVDPPW